MTTSYSSLVKKIAKSYLRKWFVEGNYEKYPEGSPPELLEEVQNRAEAQKKFLTL